MKKLLFAVGLLVASLAYGQLQPNKPIIVGNVTLRVYNSQPPSNEKAPFGMLCVGVKSSDPTTEAFKVTIVTASGSNSYVVPKTHNSLVIMRMMPWMDWTAWIEVVGQIETTTAIRVEELKSAVVNDFVN